MKRIFYNNYKTFLTSTFLFLFSLSCDDTEPVSAENPDITYSISVQTEVRNCHLLNCNDDIAYAYDVDNPLENDYHLYFQIELLDSNDDPIEGAEINIQECPLVDGDASECQPTSAQFSYFDGGTTTTSNQGFLEGYWKDSGENGSFLLTFEYVDEFETEASTTHQITINSLSDFINLNVWGETEELINDNTNIIFEDLKISDFEVTGVTLNNVKTAYFNRVTITRSIGVNRILPVSAYWSSLIFNYRFDFTN